jgi:hypothetical protein
MSRLYGSMDADASKTQATRRAHKNISAHVRGWDNGVEVHAYVDAEDRDCFEVYRTSGSNGGRSAECIARIVGNEPGSLTLLPNAWGEAAQTSREGAPTASSLQTVGTLGRSPSDASLDDRSAS